MVVPESRGKVGARYRFSAEEQPGAANRKRHPQVGLDVGGTLQPQGIPRKQAVGILGGIPSWRERFEFAPLHGKPACGVPHELALLGQLRVAPRKCFVKPFVP